MSLFIQKTMTSWNPALLNSLLRAFDDVMILCIFLDWYRSTAAAMHEQEFQYASAKFRRE